MRYSDRVNYTANAIGRECQTFDFEPRWVPTPFPRSPIWARLHQSFDTEHFLYPAPPIEVGRFDLDPAVLAGLRVLRCPIKKADESIVHLPTELGPVAEVVRHIVETELFINPRFKDFHAHVSFECTDVAAGTTQRVPGWHVDGFQGVRVRAHVIEHSYLWSTRRGTEYCLQPFFIDHLDPHRHNVFPEIERQAKPENVYETFPGSLYLIDPYVVHRSPRVEAAGLRSFLRVTFTETELEDPVNTRNLSFEEPNHPPRLEVRDRLFSFAGEVPWHSYGVKPPDES